jgi:hypothetical protein
MGTVSTPYTWRTRQELEICCDCLYMSANGSADLYADTGHAERYAQAITAWGDEPCNTDSEASFSRNPCDYCGGTLGGDRYAATVMQLHKAE